MELGDPKSAQVKVLHRVIGWDVAVNTFAAKIQEMWY